MGRKTWGTIFTLGLAAGLLASCGANESVDQQDSAQQESMHQAEAYAGVVKTSIYVKGYEGGPGVPKLIIELEDAVDSVDPSGWQVMTAGAERTVTDVYTSDANGNPQENSNFIAVDMETGFNDATSSVIGSPFTYNTTTSMNEWSTTYEVAIAAPSITIEDENYSLSITEDAINNRISPDTDLFNARGTFSGNYMNPLTDQEEEMTLSTAAYEPESLAEGEANPLVIWLHGQGEGGADPDIAILGNEVSALAKEEIQSYFTTDDVTGAYVLAVQAPTYWMDEGDGTNGNGSGISRYTKILMDTINDYVAAHPDVDTDRIYLGGCSNGGYMTMNMVIQYPDYFAAAYPICEAYAYYEYERKSDGTYVKTDDEATGTSAFVKTEQVWFTEEKIQAIKDLPIWLVQSADDPVVVPANYLLPTYQALVQAGAENTWVSYFETVEGTDSPGTTYMGHFSWIYLFNNQVTGVQDKAAIAASTDAETFGFEPSNASGGGTAAATVGETTYANIFEWLNDQSK
jgi:predicted esterase